MLFFLLTVDPASAVYFSDIRTSCTVGGHDPTQPGSSHQWNEDFSSYQDLTFPVSFSYSISSSSGSIASSVTSMDLVSSEGNVIHVTSIPDSHTELKTVTFTGVSGSYRVRLTEDAWNGYETYISINSYATGLVAESSSSPSSPSSDSDFWLWFYGLISKLLTTSLFAVIIGFFFIIAVLYFIVRELKHLDSDYKFVEPDKKSKRPYYDPWRFSCFLEGNCMKRFDSSFSKKRGGHKRK